MNDNYVEVETWGVDYERFALGKLLSKLVRKYNIATVAEMPAFGAKAMPSIYSLGLALGGADVTLINGNIGYLDQWEMLDLADKVRFVSVDDLRNTNIMANSFDFVWNFAYVPLEDDPDMLVREMTRISKKYVALFSVNGRNVGFYVHSALHKKNDIPWTHGDKQYNHMRNVAALLRRNGLRIIKKGYVDTPVWPDSLGFRDMRLHKNNITFDNAQWESPYVKMMRNNEFPKWMKLVYIWEKIPMLPIIKTLYSHIFYVIAEVDGQNE